MLNKKIKPILAFLIFIVLLMEVVITSFGDYGSSKNNDIYIQGVESIDYDDFLSKLGKYYVYVYNTTCSDCINVKEDISKLSNDNDVYTLDLGKVHDRERVDWEEFHSNNDIEIGYINQYGNKIYFDGESEEKYTLGLIKNSYGMDAKFDVIVADEIYINENKSAKINYIYAVPQIPDIDYSIYKEGDKIIVPAVPMLFEIDNNKIQNYYYDVGEIKKIVEQLESSKVYK